MTPSDIISDLPFELLSRDELMRARMLLRYLHDHVHLAEPKILDATDFKQWLRDLADEARTQALKSPEVAA